MYQYFKDYYVANNMALVLSGNFDAEEVKPLIEASFGKLKRGEVPEFPQYEKNSFEGRVVEKVRITPIKAGFMGYKLVPYAHPDRPALELIGQMMSNGNQTGFIDKLNLENEVLYAGGFQEFMEEDGSTFIFYVPKIFGKSLNTFEERIREYFQGIAAGNFSDAYFESIKYGLYRNFSLSLEDLCKQGEVSGPEFYLRPRPGGTARLFRENPGRFKRRAYKGLPRNTMGRIISSCKAEPDFRKR